MTEYTGWLIVVVTFWALFAKAHRMVLPAAIIFGILMTALGVLGPSYGLKEKPEIRKFSWEQTDEIPSAE